MNPSNQTVPAPNSRHVNRLNLFKVPLTLLAVLIISSGLSCAVAPTGGPSTTDSSTNTVAGADINSAFAAYEQRDFGNAAAAFDAVADDRSASRNDRRLAHLGKAMVHLSTDPQYRNIKEAGLQLQAAEEIKGDTNGAETSMLLHAMSALVGVESNMLEMTTKVSNSSREITNLKAERDALKAEQEGLIAEQANLNEALEKLKSLTLGN